MRYRGTQPRTQREEIMTDRVEILALYPARKGEDHSDWTGRLLTHAREHGSNRQCSIGWHGECSDPRGESCMCLCHADGFDIWSVEGHAEDGTITVTRAELGEQRWPPQPGEPDSMWAHWVFAESEEDAKRRAIAKQTIILTLDN